MHTYKIGLVLNNHDLWPWNTTACVACVKTQILGQNIYIGNENVATALHWVHDKMSVVPYAKVMAK